MSLYKTLSSSSLFFGEGDFEISFNDLKTVKGNEQVRIHALQDYLRSNFKDYALTPNLGADLDRFIGRGIDQFLQRELEVYIKSAIVNSTLYTSDEFAVYSLINKNQLVFRIVITQMADEIIQMSYTTSGGFSFG